MSETPSWAVFGSSERGFDPEQTRFHRNRNKNNKVTTASIQNDGGLIWKIFFSLDIYFLPPVSASQYLLQHCVYLGHSVSNHSLFFTATVASSFSRIQITGKYFFEVSKKVSFLSSLSSASTNSFNFEHENELLEHQIIVILSFSKSMKFCDVLFCRLQWNVSQWPPIVLFDNQFGAAFLWLLCFYVGRGRLLYPHIIHEWKTQVYIPNQM